MVDTLDGQDYSLTSGHVTLKADAVTLFEGPDPDMAFNLSSTSVHYQWFLWRNCKKTNTNVILYCCE